MAAHEYLGAGKGNERARLDAVGKPHELAEQVVAQLDQDERPGVPEGPEGPDPA